MLRQILAKQGSLLCMKCSCWELHVGDMWRVWGQGHMRGFAGMPRPRLMCLWVKESLCDYIRREDSLCHSTSKRYPGNRIPAKTNAQIGSCLWFLKSYFLWTFLGFTLSANVTVFQAFKGHHPFLEKSCLNYSLARSWNEALRINVPCIYYIRGFFSSAYGKSNLFLVFYESLVVAKPMTFSSIYLEKIPLKSHDSKGKHFTT